MLTIIGIFLAICAFFKAIYIGMITAEDVIEYNFGPKIDPVIQMFLCLGLFLPSPYLLSR